jgi:hypothetical protein
MKKVCLKLAGLAGLAATVAHADIKLNDNFAVNGYAVGSYQYDSPNTGSATDSFNLDAAKLNFLANFNPVSADLGFYYTQTAAGTSNITLLNASVAYDAGGGFSVSAGRFLSWMGFEAFDSPNKNQVSSAYINPSYTIMFYPAYHEGVRFKYSSPDWTAGVAVLDSLNGPTIYRGDGELKSNFGLEAFAEYTGIKGLVVWAGVGYDSPGVQLYHKYSETLYNVWVSYTIGDATFAAEYLYNSTNTASTGSDGLVELEYAFAPKLSTTFRISAGKLDSTATAPGLGFTKYTISPAYKITDHLIARPEISYITYSHAPIKNETFFALQAVFKF